MKKEELQERINKAIEYIEKHKLNWSYEYDYDTYLTEENINQLLKILKGE